MFLDLDEQMKYDEKGDAYGEALVTENGNDATPEEED